MGDLWVKNPSLPLKIGLIELQNGEANYSVG